MVMLLTSSSLCAALFMWRGLKWLHSKRGHQEKWSIIPTTQFVEAPWCSPGCNHGPSFHDNARQHDLSPLVKDDHFNDKYVLLSKLGRGGFGVVYKGVNLFNEDLVAVKIEVGKGRKEEIEILRSVQDCPNIIRLLEGFMLPSETVLVMELAWGSLEDLNIRNRDDELKMSIFSDIIAGVGFIHYKWIAHRDLKPANILIKKGKALLADFGIAESVKGTSGAERYVSTFCGTYAYMAPELFTKTRKLSAIRADVWSVGCIIFFLLTGNHLYEGASLQTLVDLQAFAEVDVPESVPVTAITSSLVSSRLCTALWCMILISAPTSPCCDCMVLHSFKRGSSMFLK